MTYDVASVRIWSQQTATRALREAAEGGKAPSADTSSTMSTLADILFAESEEDDSDDETQLSRLIETLRSRTSEGIEAEDEGDVSDISSKAFMKALNEKIEGLKANPETAEMAEAMQAALAAGTLTVTDAAAGSQIVAWDPQSEGAMATTAVSVPATDWPSYLREHLTRDQSGRYVRNEDSSHQDKAVGVSSYFGMIGETHYYLSWRAVATARA